MANRERTLSDNERITLTVSQETVEYLEEVYPDALEIQEAVRMAISDARDFRQTAEVQVRADSPGGNQNNDD